MSVSVILSLSQSLSHIQYCPYPYFVLACALYLTLSCFFYGSNIILSLYLSLSLTGSVIYSLSLFQSLSHFSPHSNLVSLTLILLPFLLSMFHSFSLTLCFLISITLSFLSLSHISPPPIFLLFSNLFPSFSGYLNTTAPLELSFSLNHAHIISFSLTISSNCWISVSLYYTPWLSLFIIYQMWFSLPVCLSFSLSRSPPVNLLTFPPLRTVAHP